MRPKVVDVKCNSIQDLHHYFSSIQHDVSLSETEETWDTISNAISRLTSLTMNGAAQFPSQLISSVRSVSRPLINSLYSERSKLSGTTLELFSSLAKVLESSFNPLLPLLLPPLLTLCTRTNKVFCARARSCIMDIIEHTRLPAIFPYLVDSLKDKSISLRLTAAEAALTCLNIFDPPELIIEHRAQEIETVIRHTIKDPSADVRNISRKLFEAYNILVPDRVDAFVDPLTPTAKKYLNIKPKLIAKGSGSSSSGTIRKAHEKLLHQSASSSQLQQSSNSLRDAKLTHSNFSKASKPPTRPGLKAEQHISLKSVAPQKAVGNHLSSGSLKDASMASSSTESRKPVVVLPHVGPVRCPVVPTIGPVRLSKQPDALPSRVAGPVRLPAAAIGTRSASDGPRRVTIVPMPPPSSKDGDAKKPVATGSTKDIRAAFSRTQKPSKNQFIRNKPAVPARPGPVPEIPQRSIASEWKKKPDIEPQSQKTTSLRTHPTAKVGQTSDNSQTAPKRNPQRGNTGKSVVKEKVRAVTTTPSEEVAVAALIALPPSPTVSSTVDAGTVIEPDTEAEAQFASSMSQETKHVEEDGFPSVAMVSKIDQTPISALVTSIERGFRFPNYPPLPALAIVEEGEDESFDLPQICQQEVQGLKIRSKSNSNGQKDLERPVLFDMPFNR